MKTCNLKGLSVVSVIFQPCFIINMKNTMKKIKYIFKVLKYVVFCVFYMTFYNLWNSVKLPPKNAGNGISGILDLKTYPRHAPNPRRCFWRPRYSFCPPPPSHTLVWSVTTYGSETCALRKTDG